MLRPTLLTRDSDPILIEALRPILNANLSYFTRPLPEMTPEGQQRWWKIEDHANVRVFLWRDDERPWEAVAFSMLTDHGDYASPFFAVAPAHWSSGFGDQIIKHYIEAAGKPLKGEQLASNGAIRHLNTKNGWYVTGEKDGVQTLYHPGPGPRVPEWIRRHIRAELGYPDYDAILKGLDG